MSTEIDECIAKAEILSLNGDTQGYKDILITDLSKIRQEFLSKFNSHKILLQYASNFVNIYNSYEEALAKFQSKYTNLSVPDDVI